MADSKNYFAKAPLKGLGKLHFLVTPQRADSGSSALALLGTLVNEIDRGMFNMKQVPGLDHAWKRQCVLKVLEQTPALSGEVLINEVSLANVDQTLAVEKKFNLGVDAAIPGVPASGSVGIDFSKLRNVTINLGAGCKKLYIPTGFLKAGYDHAQQNSNKFDPQLFYDDYMCINQIVVTRKMSLIVESNSEFSANFKAKADQISGLGLGISYDTSKKRTVTIAIDDGKDYLFAVGAVELEQLKG